ncbi:hypothetical protein GGR88_002706 [Sphingomonas jejuensis]|uniref:Metal-dependent hydrolase n=1 Tax=Sphingomonas jejuensis TaxID=904715 RepID=A0ABX0XR63_9SPHN|nr:hypothetical protein [Sphingomonas jejuensis]NJC35192.1 hypothetical protein [Sphingomonas jejuensis]
MWLAVACLAAVAARHWPPAAMAAVILATVAGLDLPDIDAAVGLPHRSGLTHSLLPAMPALLRRRWHPVAAGLAIGLGMHLAADSFPNAMTGYATVKLPLAGGIGAAGSYLWLGLNAVAATAVGVSRILALFGRTAALVLLATLTVIGAGYLLRTDGGWPVLALGALAGWLMLRR